jgi:hypothetical protein
MPKHRNRSNDLSGGRERLSSALQKPWSEIAQQADMHTRAVQSWLATRAPDAERMDGMGITAVSTGLRVRLLNLALGYEYTPSISDAEVDAELDAVKAFFARRGIPWSWWISRQSLRSDFDQRLKQHGLEFSGPLPAMVAALPMQSRELAPNINVWRASTRDDLQAASTIRRTAFRFPEGSALTYFEDMADDWLDADRNEVWLYLASIEDGPPASVGALIVREAIAGV